MTQIHCTVCHNSVKYPRGECPACGPLYMKADAQAAQEVIDVLFQPAKAVTVAEAEALFAEATQAPDTVHHPKHYNAHPSGVECITVTEHMNFNVGNAVKYLWRADEKGADLEDLKKARWYVDREISRREGRAPSLAERLK